MQTVVDNLLTNYVISGKGRDILLLHGWGDTSATFRLLTEQLQADYRLISVDLPGFGSTQQSPNAWNLDDYARFLNKFIEKADIKPFAIVGHSNGGAVAIRGISMGVLGSERLVLLASAGIRDQQKARRLVIKLVAKAGKAATFWLPENKKKDLRKKLYGVAGSDLHVVPHLQETFKKTVSQDVQADATKLNLPTLLIYGTEDKATPPLYARIYTRLIPGARLEMIRGASHHVHHDNPETVANLIRKFLS